MLERGGASVVRPHPAVRTLLLTKGEVTAVVLDERTWHRHELGASAAAVWAFLDEPRGVDELVADIVATFGISRDRAASAVEDAIRAFDRLGLLAHEPEEEWTSPPPSALPDEDARPLRREHDP